MPQNENISQDLMEETKNRHQKYLRAMNSPVRRDILRAIKEGNKSLTSLSDTLGLDAKVLEWHLNFLIYGYCIEKKTLEIGAEYELTKEGQVVDFLDKSTTDLSTA